MTELEQRLTNALAALSGQYEREQKRQAEQAEDLQQQVQQLAKQVGILSEQYALITADYKKITEALRRI